MRLTDVVLQEGASSWLNGLVEQVGPSGRPRPGVKGFKPDLKLFKSNGAC